MISIMSLCVFDVLKIVRSLGCDHGHDEESRNGREIKIDILDGYIRTPARAGRPSPLLLYIRGQGHPRTHKLIVPSRVRCPPTTIIQLDHIITVLRRSPASVATSSPSSHYRADGTLL